MPVRKLPAYLSGIHPNRVNESIREKVILYQEECDDALWSYWSQGMAVNPRTESKSILPGDQQHLQNLVASKTSHLPAEFRSKGIAEAWSRVHNKFKVAKYQDLTPDQYPEAVAYIITMELKAKPKPEQLALPSATAITPATKSTLCEIFAQCARPLAIVIENSVSERQAEKFFEYGCTLFKARLKDLGKQVA